MGVRRGKKEAIEPKTGSQGELETYKIVTLESRWIPVFVSPPEGWVFYSDICKETQILYCGHCAGCSSNKWDLPSKCRDRWQIRNGKEEKATLET